MYQTSTQASAGFEELYGAVAETHASYSRVIPQGIQQPAFDWISMRLARFDSFEMANTLLPEILDDWMASIREQWPTVDMTETVLPTTLDTASRQLFSGTISRQAESMFSGLMLLQANDIVALIGGYSSWSPIEFEIAYLGDIVSSLAANDEGGDLASILPSADLLVGGLQIRE